jgi:hypothetical protein
MVKYNTIFDFGQVFFVDYQFPFSAPPFPENRKGGRGERHEQGKNNMHARRKK